MAKQYQKNSGCPALLLAKLARDTLMVLDQHHLRKDETVSREQVTALLSQFTITPDELYQAKILPLSRNGIYEAIRRGELEVIELGKKKAIVTAPLRRKLGLDDAGQK
ncbi:hypothetical protein ACFFWD_03670 [Bradyrhizobium erythrophlei]|uniref:hypothetical protein n=1 Tax=Bradyrhizobium erythrophlei TaxID=1437360 RepID=UPI0035F09D6F